MGFFLCSKHKAVFIVGIRGDVIQLKMTVCDNKRERTAISGGGRRYKIVGEDH